MNNDVIAQLKNHWLIPAIFVLLCLFFVVKTFNLSFTDYVADRVIQKLEVEYMPHGPNGPPAAGHAANKASTPIPSSPWTRQ